GEMGKKREKLLTFPFPLSPFPFPLSRICSINTSCSSFDIYTKKQLEHQACLGNLLCVKKQIACSYTHITNH
ncbi:MAG TPA: hypothetical protein V6D25_28720, partial [Leptolyngbyaceae cyanobacterium]